MVVDYRTLRHKGEYVVFLESSDDMSAAIFSSLKATLKFLKLMSNYRASVHDRGGRLIGYMQNGGITLLL